MTTTREILIRARALIDTPEKWCHGNPFDPHFAEGSLCAALAISHR